MPSPTKRRLITERIRRMNKASLGKTVAVAIVTIGVVAAALAFKPRETVDHSSGTMPGMNDSMSGQSSTASEVIETNMVTYKNFEVKQPKIRVKQGTTVTWTNEDSAKHDVTPTNETEEFKASQLFGKGETYSVTFNTVGTYSYICSPHPYMKGSVEVVEK